MPAKELKSEIPEDIVRPAFIIIDTTQPDSSAKNTFLDECFKGLNTNVTFDKTDYFVLTSNIDTIKTYCKETESNNTTIGTISGLKVKFFYYMPIAKFEAKVLYYYLANLTNSCKSEYSHFYIMPDTFRLEHPFGTDYIVDLLLLEKDTLKKEALQEVIPSQFPVNLDSFFKNTETMTDYNMMFMGGSYVSQLLNDIMNLMFAGMNNNILLRNNELYLDIIVSTEMYLKLNRKTLSLKDHIDSWLNASIRLHSSEIETQKKSLIENLEQNKDKEIPENKEVMKIQLSRANDYNHDAIFFEMSNTCSLSLYNGYKIVRFDFEE